MADSFTQAQLHQTPGHRDHSCHLHHLPPSPTPPLHYHLHHLSVHLSCTNLQPPLERALPFTPSLPITKPRHGEGAAHDALGHPQGLHGGGRAPPGQAEHAGALRQLQPHTHLSVAHLRHRVVDTSVAEPTTTTAQPQ